ncbi:hypothetical protein KGF56_001343 [Candida oxycetoniae]|uniref:Transmembrane protein 135 N-terminal domain-containing protein n=1 Tax=Candida oxycetoniae TaxID=497107 RepID=A0AAI9SYY5_9ASCO|nr:uncharacterized protein KGF56_001343 [Candida oxycetoniae]KAI3405736.2 hypothetical protein KGF56_001343 [Candida oxycetoniae]
MNVYRYKNDLFFKILRNFYVKKRALVLALVRRLIINIRSISKGSIRVFKAIFLQRSTIFIFSVAYLSEVLPKLFRVVTTSVLELKVRNLPRDIAQTLILPLKSDKLSMFLIRLTATMNVLNPLFTKILIPFCNEQNTWSIPFVSSFLAALTSSLLNFPEFQKQRVLKDRYYTFDWTLILVTKALDTIISSTVPKFIDLPSRTSKVIDSLLVMSSIYFLMDAWFFNTEKLNPSYSKRLNKMSHIDEDLLAGMRYLRDGYLDYKPNSQLSHQDHFIKFAEKYSKDPKLGDLTIQEKLPCVVLHQFVSESCLQNAFYKFMMQFRTALKFYGSINLFVYILVKKLYASPIAMLIKTVKYSLFLSSLTTIQWSCICLVRNYHPNIYDQKFWDLLGPRIGAALAGMGIWFETGKRTSDLLMILAPKALGTFFDSTPTMKNLRFESLAFSLSFATLVVYARSNPKRLRGLIGRGFSYMIK